MAKKLSLGFLDAALDAVAACNVMHICSAEPADVAGIAAVSLGSVAVDAGDFSKAGTVANRVLTIAPQTISATANGTPTHAVLSDGTDICVTTMTASAVESGTDYNVEAITLTPAVA